MIENISAIMQKMIDMSNGNMHDINHFMKVYAFSRMIGLQEGLPEITQTILEAAAVIHDIACPLCREKYGNTNGKFQEQEGVLLARNFLSGMELSDEAKERIIYLVGHHHTYTVIDGMDYQILLEADFLVNADEGKMSFTAIKAARERFFKTKTGIDLLDSMYLKESFRWKPPHSVKQFGKM